MFSTLLSFILMLGLTMQANSAVPEACKQLKQPVNEQNVTAVIFDDEGNYFERPVKNALLPIHVNVKLVIQALVQIQEVVQLVTLRGYFYFSWFDEYHKWNDNFPLACVESIIMPHGEDSNLWMPDVSITGADERYLVSTSGADRVILRNDGFAKYTPGGTIAFHCEFDLSMFPFDVQKCDIQLGSKYTKELQHLHLPNPPVEFVNLTNNEEWEIISTDGKHDFVFYSLNNTFYSEIRFYITFRRKAGYFLLTLVLPCLFISAVEALTFTLHPGKGMRMEISFTCLLSFSVYQTFVTSEMPRSAEHPPLVSVYVCLMMAFIAGAVVFQSIGMIFIEKGKRKEPMPFIIELVVKYLGWALCTFKKKGKEVADVHRVSEVQDNEDNEDGRSVVSVGASQSGDPTDAIFQDWRYAAKVWDRLAVTLYIFCWGGSSVFILGILPQTKGVNK